MKKLLLIALLGISSVANADFNDNNRNDNNRKAGGGFIDGKYSGPISTVQQALQARDDTPVTLTGHIVSRAGNDDDEFIFRDGTGDIRIEVEDNAWNGQNVSPTDKVTIQGEVDRNRFSKSTVDVYSIQKH